MLFGNVDLHFLECTLAYLTSHSTLGLGVVVTTHVRSTA